MYCMSFSPMKEGVGKADVCYSLFHLSIVTGFDTLDVDSFNGTTTIDFNCPIGMDSGDHEWTSGGCAHFWLTVAFICVEYDEHLVTWEVLLNEAVLVFLLVGGCE
jgi:hypothetical protein